MPSGHKPPGHRTVGFDNFDRLYEPWWAPPTAHAFIWTPTVANGTTAERW